MSKSKTIYICSECGYDSPKWQGQCSNCGAWNTLEVKILKEPRAIFKAESIPGKPENLSNIQIKEFKRIPTNISEFDRVLGGGIVPGSLILLGGDPGIGKSTLLLQICDKIGNYDSSPTSPLYISGEESAQQLKLHADRLGMKHPHLQIMSEVDIDKILVTVEQLKPALVIIDSIQTMYSENIPALPGSINQVRIATIKLAQVAKSNSIPIFLIGHVTKEGVAAGPKTLEHMVDTVLYLEGEKFSSFRILRGVKNRFGSTNEAGVFEMTNQGVKEIKNPSGVFLEQRQIKTPGSAVTTTLEGTRIILTEIQALTSPTSFGYPRRTASGIDFNRLQLLIAVLQKRAGLALQNSDVYVNVAGGFKIIEPAVDLAISLAIAYSLKEKIVDPELVAIGEIGLSGGIRSVNQMEKRIKEVSIQGFKKCLIPGYADVRSNIQIIKAQTLNQAIDLALR